MNNIGTTLTWSVWALEHRFRSKYKKKILDKTAEEWQNLEDI